MEACRGRDIDVDLVAILGNRCFPTYSTTIRSEEIINLKKHLPLERRQFFPDQGVPCPVAHPLGPLGPAANGQRLGSPSRCDCRD